MNWHIIIDDEGRAWPDYSVALRRLLGTTRSPKALLPFVINNMGFASLGPHRTGCILNLTATSVSVNAVIGVIYWLSEYKPERVVVQERTAAGLRQTLFTLPAAFKYLDCLLAQRGAQPLFAAKLLAPSASPFADRWEAARVVLQAEMAEATRTAILNKLFGNFFIITRRDSANGQFVIETVGDVYRQYRDVFGDLTAGTPLAKTLDKSYGEWVCNRYAKLDFNGAPTVERIDARFPYSQLGGTKISYTRLLIPFARGEEKFVLTASVA